jgi:hypothetical protein
VERAVGTEGNILRQGAQFTSSAAFTYHHVQGGQKVAWG